MRAQWGSGSTGGYVQCSGSGNEGAVNGSSGYENQGLCAAANGSGHRMLVRTGSTATVATTTDGYWQRQSKLSQGHGATDPAVEARTRTGEAGAIGLNYGRQRLCGAHAAESSSVRARSCRAQAGTGGGSGLRQG